MHFKIQYKVHQDQVEENKRAVEEFVTAIKNTGDKEYSYTSWTLPDGVSFVHLAWFADEEAKKRFQSAPHFKKFAEGLPARCEEKPQASPLTLVASSA